MSVVLVATAVGNVLIVLELTPPTDDTVGKLALPDKSPANWIIPLVDVVASGIVMPLILLSINDFTALVEGYLSSEFASVETSDDLFALSSFKFKALCVEDKIADFTFVIFVCTNSLLATWLELSVKAAVGVVGIPINFGDSKVLFVKTSTPSNVAIVPVVGNVILLAPVVVIVKSPVPLTDRLLFNVIFLPVGLATPVPPISLGSVFNNFKAPSDTKALFA